MTLGSWIDNVIEHNQAEIERLASAIVSTDDADGLVVTAGSGHSLAMVMETFFRAGGLARIRPVFVPEILPLVGAMASTTAERQTGLGTHAMSEIPLSSSDTVVIFSNSGRNPYPIEVARAAHEAGATVAGFTSVSASAEQPSRSGERLFEVADIVLDTRTPPGDASEPPEQPVTSPLSTIACAALWSRVLARVVQENPDVALWRSANRDGNDEYNALLAEQLKGRIPQI